MKGLGIDLEAAEASGNLKIVQTDAAELSPGEFADRVQAVRPRRKIRS